MTTATRPGPAPERRTRAAGVARQLPSFAVVGAACTAAYLALFWVLRTVLGALTANTVAMLVTAVANTSANRRFTFGVRGRAGALRHHLGGLLAFAIGLVLTTAGLALLPAGSSRTEELAAAVLANAFATLVRFTLLRGIVLTGTR